MTRLLRTRCLILLLALQAGSPYVSTTASPGSSCKRQITSWSPYSSGGCPESVEPEVGDCDGLMAQYNESMGGSTWYEYGHRTEYLETCFTGGCSISGSTVENVPITGYNLGCGAWDLVEAPIADESVCNPPPDGGVEGCPCDQPCPDVAGTQSLWFKMRLTSGVGHRTASYLWIYQKEAEKRLYTPAVLTVGSSKDLKVYRNPDHTIRQILSPSTLANVVVTSPQSFEVAMYAVTKDKKLARDKDGYLVPEGAPLRTYRFSNPDADKMSRYQIDTLTGQSTRTREFTWDESQTQWTLKSAKDASTVSEAINHYDKEKRLFTKISRARNLATGLQRDTVHLFHDFPFGRRLISTEKRLGEQSLSKDTYTYGEDKADAATYGRLTARLLHDGSWERFEYDTQGRVVKKLTPWKDSPVGSEENEVRVETHAYLAIDPASPFYHPTAQFVRTDELISGTAVTTTYRLQTIDRVTGGRMRIEEKAATAGARFAAEGNHRVTSRYYPEREADPASGLIQSTENADGTVVSFTYESGDYSGEEGVPGNFDPRIGGLYTRTTRIQGTAAHPQGIPGRSLAGVTIAGPEGRTLLEESRLIQGEGKESALLSWTGHAYDHLGRKILSRDTTGIIAELRYNPCCNKVEWERDRNGIETSYMRDPDERITAKIVSAPGRPDVESHYEFDAMGRVTRETIVAGELVQETTREYDEEGELIATTTPDGLTTRYEHDHEARTHTTILPGGATQVENRYLDGQVKAVTGTAVVAQHHDYGVTPDTALRWSQTTLAKADGPRWTRSHIDALGQAILQEQPGHGEGIVLAAHTAYDEKGRPIATQSGWKKVATGADGGPEGTFNPLGPVTLQTHDAETGELLYSGQDLNLDDQLTPGQSDRVTKSESRIEKIGNHWWEVSRQWTYPLELTGQPYLVGEIRQRLTGLGVAAEDPALGVLVSESIQILPGNEEPRTKNLEQRSVTYRHRDTGVVTSITTDPNGLSTIQRTESGLVTSVETTKNEEQGTKNQTTFSYDPLGRRVGVQDPRTGESKTVYDPKNGQVIAQIDPENHANRYAYYPADHPSAGKLAFSANAEGKEQHIAYTTRGEQRAVWGASIQPLLYEYNEYGEMVGMKTFQTLPNGDPSLEDDKGAKTAWHFHEATGSLLKKEYADGHGPEYAYSEAGQLSERQWARESNATNNGAGAPVGATGPVARSDQPLATAYTYDPATLQLTKSSATDGTAVTYEYTPEGQLAKVTDATGTREFTYDLRGKILKESVTLLRQGFGGLALPGEPNVEPIRYEIRRTYTALGQPASVHLVSADGETFSLDHKVDYSWNAHNQLTSVKSLAGEFVYGYDTQNPALLTKMTGPVHEVETTYEPHRNLITGVTNRILTPSHEDTKGKVISSYVYGNDVLGRRETISQGGEAFAMLKLGEAKVDVAYNDRSEVVGASYFSGNETRQEFVYEYDEIGNRKRSASGVGGQKSEISYKTNALNQYESIRENSSPLVVQNPSHDPDGNLIEDHKNRYSWDAENRLISVESKDATFHLGYVYDHQSRRTMRTETKNPGKANEEKKTTYYVYDDWNLLAELEETKNEEPGTKNIVQRTFTWGRDLSGSLQGAGGVGGLLAVTKRNATTPPERSTKNEERGTEGETRFALYDANGNVGQLINADGAIVAAYAYDPFGNVADMAGGEAESNPWRFSTKPADTATGLMYYGFRYYAPELGRWVSRDPIGETGGSNLYGFVGNDGVGATDLLGLEPEFDGVNHHKGMTNCLGFACGYDDASLNPITTNAKKILAEEGYVCTKGIGAIECENHCNCEQYLVLYFYAKIKEYQGKWDLAKEKKDYYNKYYGELFERPMGVANQSYHFDMHALKGGADGYTNQPYHNSDSNNLSDYEKKQRKTPWKPSDESPDFFPPEQILDKYCCCKKE